jgi:phospholipase/carboxylesterase
MGAQSMKDAIIVQRPSAASPSLEELLLLFHGVGSRAEDLVPLGRALAVQRPGAWIVSVRSPDPSDLGSGWQWFSVRGVTEENRYARVRGAMPSFQRTVAAWQRETGTGPEATTLIGFSQGAIMALEATQQEVSPATRVIAIAGRFAQAPQRAPAGTTVHLLHGERDPVMPISVALEAHDQLRALGATSTLDRFPGLVHGIDARVVECVQSRLATETSAALR